MKRHIAGISLTERLRLRLYGALRLLHIVTPERELEVFVNIMEAHGAVDDGANIFVIMNPMTGESYVFPPDMMGQGDLLNAKQGQAIREGICREPWVV